MMVNGRNLLDVTLQDAQNILKEEFRTPTVCPTFLVIIDQFM